MRTHGPTENRNTAAADGDGEATVAAGLRHLGPRVSGRVRCNRLTMQDTLELLASAAENLPRRRP
jgi:hypothetical protein